MAIEIRKVAMDQKAILHGRIEQEFKDLDRGWIAAYLQGTTDLFDRVWAAARPDRSSQGVRSWVVEFKKTRRGESLIAFDSLFKDALLPSGQAD